MYLHFNLLRAFDACVCKDGGGGEVGEEIIGYRLRHIRAFNSYFDVKSGTIMQRVTIHLNKVKRSVLWGSLKSRRSPEVR